MSSCCHLSFLLILAVPLVVVEEQFFFHLENVSNGALSTIVNPCSSDTPFLSFLLTSLVSFCLRAKDRDTRVVLSRVGLWDGGHNFGINIERPAVQCK